jgi:V/A-type H+-transporting ATPase subunit K
MRRFALPLLLMAGALLAALATVAALLPEIASAQTGGRVGLPAEAYTWGLAAAALATAASAIAGGYAVAKLGAAAVGALAEKPDLFGRLLIFVGLAEGIAIYGVIISILILNRLT